MSQQRIAFVGAGQMARALARGFVQASLVAPEEVLAADPLAEARAGFAEAVPGCVTTDDNGRVAESEVVFLATKPQHLGGVLAGLRGQITADQLVVSIAAGITLATLNEALPEARLVRVMPNTPCLIAQGASAYAPGPRATEADVDRVGRLLAAVGYAVRLDEKLLDAVTGLSGSGPAFGYVMIEALSDGGVRMGLPREVALDLAAHTLRGSAEMVLAGDAPPSVLKDRVASPGGTTIAGLQSLENAGLRAALISAVEVATHRSVELGTKT